MGKGLLLDRGIIWRLWANEQSLKTDQRKYSTMKKMIFGLAAALALSGICWAQAAQAPAGSTDSLTVPAKQVIERLGQLNNLPAGQWRVHAGDLPHGESPDLDDSSWPVAKVDSEYSSDALWFREWIDVPANFHGYDLTGARIWFRFQARAVGTGGLTEIVYFNGRRVALGESLERLVLVDGAKPPERILVAVKLLATDGIKRFQGAQHQIEFAQGRPNPQDMRDEFLSAALLVPSLSKEVQADEATLDKAIEQVDLKALDAADQKSFDASLRHRNRRWRR